MKTEKIIDRGLTLAIIVRGNDWKKGLGFITSEEDYQQVGTWNYDKGQKLAPHIHLSVSREVMHTQEVVHIKRGSLRANIFTVDRELLKSIELREGDTIILLNGGHGYDILEDNTQVLEVKNGPYPGAEKDRERI